MTLKRTDAIVMSAVLVLVLYTFSLWVVVPVLSSLQTSRKISSTGAVKVIGVEVYQDYECTSPVSSIDWGVLEPGSSENFACYVRNEGNSASTLSMHTSNWSPSGASDYMTLSWDYGGQSINPDEVVQVTFTLSVSADIDGITSFSFDTTIVGSG